MKINCNSSYSPRFGFKISSYMKFKVLYESEKFFSTKDSKKILKLLKKNGNKDLKLENFRLYSPLFDSEIYCDVILKSIKQKDKCSYISACVGSILDDTPSIERLKPLINAKIG